MMLEIQYVLSEFGKLVVMVLIFILWMLFTWEE
jgi:hypothetical protein